MRPRRPAIALAAAAALVLAGRAGATTPAPRAEIACPRLVTMAPNLTELAFALGLGERVVGVGDHGRWPPEVAQLPRLGGLVDPHVEQIVALRPSLVAILPSQDDLGRRLERLGIATVVVPSEDLDDVAAGARLLAGRCGEAAAGRALAARLDRELAPRPLSGAPRVLVTVGRPAGELGQIFAAGPGTFVDELLTRLGAVNLLADAPARWPQVGVEEILARDPDVIVELQGEELAPARQRELLADWTRLPSLGAVRRGAVRVVAGEEVLLPGPRLPLLYEALRAAVADAAAAGSDP